MFKFVRAVVVLALFVAIFILIWKEDTLAKTPTEFGLIGILLTILSLLGSWILSHIYSELTHQNELTRIDQIHKESLRTYALKASEKVTNLSNELSRLAVSLEAELDDQEFSNAELKLQSRELKVESAIHLITTLKNANDTSLSDWKGVIGEELEQQREDREETLLAVLHSLMERVDEIEKYQLELISKDSGQEGYEELNELKIKIDQIRNSLKHAEIFGGVNYPYQRPHKQRYDEVSEPCPNCGKPVSYRHRTKLAIKGVACKSCGQKLVSRRLSDDVYALTIRQDVPETVSCPNCNRKTVVTLDVFPSATARYSCECGSEVRVVRLSDGIRTEEISSVPEHLIKKVQSQLPDQPWPKHTHIAVAEKIGAPTKDVQKAIQVFDSARHF